MFVIRVHGWIAWRIIEVTKERLERAWQVGYYYFVLERRDGVRGYSCNQRFNALFLGRVKRMVGESFKLLLELESVVRSSLGVFYSQEASGHG